MANNLKNYSLLIQMMNNSIDLLVHLSGTEVDPLVLAVEEEAGLDPLWESLATLGRDCARSIGTLMSSQSFKRTSTRNTQTLVTGHL